MGRHLVRILYDVHGGLGATLGVALFFASLSGVVALFHEELAQWTSPSVRIPLQADVAIDDMIASAVMPRVPEDTRDLYIELPDRWRPTVRAKVYSRDPAQKLSIELDPTTGEVLAETGEGFDEVWRRAHTNLLMARVGRYAMGFLGMAMLFLVISGLLMHRKMWKEAFRLRLGGSRRGIVAHLHKQVGLWGSLFHVMIAFTGTVLGLLGLLTIASALVAYGGDRDRAVEAVLGPQIEASGTRSPSGSVDRWFRLAREDDAFVDWEQARLMLWNDEHAHVELSGFSSVAIAMGSQVRYRVSDGERVHVVDWTTGSIWHRLFGLIMPLHYADFGGLVMKVLYAVLGLASALSIATGLLIWLERRRKAADRLNATKVARLASGTMGGTLFATFALPVLDLLTRFPPDVRYERLVWAFAALLAVSVVWGALRAPTRALRELTAASGVACVLAPMIRTLVDGLAPWAALQQGYGNVAGADLGFFVTGVALLVTARYLPDDLLPDRAPPDSSIGRA